MPQHQQFKKNLKVSEKARLRNIAAKSRLKTMVKKVEQAKSKDQAQEEFRKAVAMIDSTARKGIIKKKTAARKKSRLSKTVAGME